LIDRTTGRRACLHSHVRRSGSSPRPRRRTYDAAVSIPGELANARRLAFAADEIRARDLLLSLIPRIEREDRDDLMLELLAQLGEIYLARGARLYPAHQRLLGDLLRDRRGPDATGRRTRGHIRRRDRSYDLPVLATSSVSANGLGRRDWRSRRRSDGVGVVERQRLRTRLR